MSIHRASPVWFVHWLAIHRPTTAFLMRQLIVASRLGRTEYQLLLMKISWWDRNVKIRYKLLVVIDEFLTVPPPAFCRWTLGFLLHLLWMQTFRASCAGFLQAGYPLCHPQGQHLWTKLKTPKTYQRKMAAHCDRAVAAFLDLWLVSTTTFTSLWLVRLQVLIAVITKL